MVEILTVLFFLELSLFVMVDYHKYSTIYTPVLFLGVPFAFVLLVAVFVSSHVGFLPVSEYAVLIWCLGLILFWLSGSILTFAAINTKVVFPFVKITTHGYITTFIGVVSWIFIIILFVSFSHSYLLHGTIGGEDFSRDFASRGIAAHCLSLMKYNVAYLVTVRNTNKIHTSFIVILTFMFLFLYNVKGGIILTALVCLFAKFIMSQSKLNFGKILIVILFGVIFFVLSYVIALGSFNFNFIIFHFLAYVIAGIVGLSEHLRQGLPVDTDFLLIIQPIRNLYNALSGGEVASTISEYWVATSTIYAKKSNVKTLFGSIYMYSGLIKGILVVSIFGITSYFFLVITILKKNLIYLILYLFMISSLMLGWFDYLFNNLFYYEVIVYAFFVTFMSKLLSIVFCPRFICKAGASECIKKEGL